MKVSAEMISRLKSAAENLSDYYDVVAIRVQEPAFELGEISHVSHVWDDGNDTGVELDGICAISSAYADRVFGSRFFGEYPGNHVAIIAGNRCCGGEDFGEVVISDPVVVEVLA